MSTTAASTLLVCPPNLEAIPAELQAGRFVCSRKGVPYIPGTDRRAKSNDPSTWRSFDEAVTAYRRGGYGGIMLATQAEDDIVGHDLDDCADQRTGHIEPWAMVYVRLLSSYTEWSPSGSGLRIFVKAKKTSDRCRRGLVECYEQKQFVSVTGHHVDGTPTTIEERQAELEAFERLVFGPAVPKGNGQSPTTPVAVSEDDAKLLEVGCQRFPAFARLLQGDISAYDSDKSGADWGLCRDLLTLTGHDVDRSEQLARNTAALAREKWDDRRGDTTYIRYTLDRALEDLQANGHQGNGHKPPSQWQELKAEPPDANANGHPTDSSDLHADCVPRKQYDDLKAEKERLLSENAQLKQHGSLLIQVKRNRALPAHTRQIGTALIFELASRGGRRLNTDPRYQVDDAEDGFQWISAETLAKQAGTSKASITRHTKIHEHIGIIDRKETTARIREIDEDTGEVTSQVTRPAVLYRLKHESADDALKALATAELPPEQPRHGGAREKSCEDHPHAGTYGQKLTRCRRCHKILDQDPPWPPPDYEGERDRHPKSTFHDETSLSPQSSFQAAPTNNHQRGYLPNGFNLKRAPP